MSHFNLFVHVCPLIHCEWRYLLLPCYYHDLGWAKHVFGKNCGSFHTYRMVSVGLCQANIISQFRHKSYLCFSRFINYSTKRCPYSLMTPWVFAINFYIIDLVSSSIFKRFHWTKLRSRKFGHHTRCWLFVVSSKVFSQFITTFNYLFQTSLRIFLDLECWPWHWLSVSTERQQKYNLMSNCTMCCNSQGVSGLICLES